MYCLCLIFSKNLNAIQATEVAVDEKFKSFGSRLQEAARKIKDMEMRMEWQAAILPQNTEDYKALRNRIHDPGNQAQIKKCQVGRGSWKSEVRINWDCFPITQVLGCGGGWYNFYYLCYVKCYTIYFNKPAKWNYFFKLVSRLWCWMSLLTALQLFLSGTGLHDLLLMQAGKILLLNTHCFILPLQGSAAKPNTWCSMTFLDKKQAEHI